MPGNPQVSVVIPSHNSAPLLEKALDSVMAQSFTEWEAIVVNHNSQDNTIEVVNAFDDPRITLVNYFHQPGVIGASRNQGVKRARAEWVAFLDADDMWDPEKLEVCMAQASADVGVISHPESIVRDDLVIGSTAPGNAVRASYKNLLFKGNIFSPTATLVRKTLLDEMAGFSEDPELITVEDYDLWLRLAKRRARCAFLDRTLSQYTLHPANSTAAIDRHMVAGLEIIKRHFENFDNRSFIDAIRYRCARALVVYGAGRNHHHAKNSLAALRHFGQAFRIYPLIPKLYVAIALSLIRAVTATAPKYE